MHSLCVYICGRPALKVVAEPPEKKPTLLPGNIDLTALGQHMLMMASGASSGAPTAHGGNFT